MIFELSLILWNGIVWWYTRARSFHFIQKAFTPHSIKLAITISVLLFDLKHRNVFFSLCLSKRCGCCCFFFKCTFYCKFFDGMYSWITPEFKARTQLVFFSFLCYVWGRKFQFMRNIIWPYTQNGSQPSCKCQMGNNFNAKLCNASTELYLSFSLSFRLVQMRLVCILLPKISMKNEQT